MWTTLGSCDIKPTEWGWKNDGARLRPIATDLEPAPSDLLKVIRCNCKSSTSNQCLTNVCTCRKNGLHCIAACGNCHGLSCFNSFPPDLDWDIDAEDELVWYEDEELVWEHEETE